MQTKSQQAVKSQGGIRPFERGDLDTVTALYKETFLKRERRHDDGVRDYYEHIYLDNPWMDDRFPSLVFEQGGVVRGFLGVIPRRMRFHGRAIHVAVSSSLMVEADPAGNRNPVIGVSLLRRFLAGEQDLSLTDTANDITRGIWTSSGGSIAHPYCYSWIRPLRPLQTGLTLGVKSPLARALATPLARLGDLVLGNLPPLKPPLPDSQVRDIGTAELVELMKALPKRAIMPDHDLESLEWLIRMAEKSESEGPLVKREVMAADGKSLGCYVYYRNRSGIGRVLQLAAFPRSMDIVLDSLIDEAGREGLAALKGRTEPDHVSLFTKRRCIFQGRPWVLVHSTEPEIIQAFQNADALLTGFDGELWMKFNA